MMDKPGIAGSESEWPGQGGWARVVGQGWSNQGGRTRVAGSEWSVQGARARVTGWSVQGGRARQFLGRASAMGWAIVIVTVKQGGW